MLQKFCLRLSSAALIGAFITAASTAHAREFSGVYVFGDSLSDAGSLTSLVTATTNRFTTNPGTVWAENLAASYGHPITTAYTVDPSTGTFSQLTTGTDFAVGGARVNAVPGVLSAFPTVAANIPSISTQVGDLLARGNLDSNGLYVVWAGANDVFTQIGVVSAVGASAIPTAQTALGTAAADLATQIGRLQAAGAKNIVVIGVPNIGATPFAVSGGAPLVGLATQMTSGYNAALTQAITGSGVLYFDSARLFNDVLTKPSTYGITNTSIPACGAASALGCTAAANGALFADGVHPSTLVHQIISDWLRNTLEATSRAGMLAALPLGRSGAQWRGVDAQMRDFQNYSTTGAGMFYSADYASGHIDGTANSESASGSTRSLMVGYQRVLNPQWQIGAALGYENAPFDLGNNAGHINYDEWGLIAFSSYKTGAWYVNGLVSYSWLDYNSTRNFTLGPSTASESGDSRGRHAGVRLQAGYLIHSGGLIHGPLIGIDGEKVTVDAYSEKSGSLSALSYGEQSRKAVRSRLGYQLAGEDLWGNMRVRPYAQLSYEYQHAKDERDALVGFSGSSMIAIPTANRTGGYGLLAVGATMRVVKDIDLGVGLTGTVGQPGGRNTSLRVSLSVPL